MDTPFVRSYSYVGGPVIRQDCENFDTALKAMAEYFHIPQTQKDALLSNTSLLQRVLEDECSPQNFFTPLACGAFKECYALLDSPQFIVKFCSQLNKTDKEIYILEQADEAGLAPLFLPTYFVPITSCALPAELLDEEHADDSSRWTLRDPDGESVTQNPDWEVPVLKYIEVQPRISRLAYPKDTYLSKESYLDCPWLDENGNEIPWEIINAIGASSREWLAAVIRCYGVDTLIKLASFCEEFGVYDLHNNNVGYLVLNNQEYPVILDWLSV